MEQRNYRLLINLSSFNLLITFFCFVIIISFTKVFAQVPLKAALNYPTSPGRLHNFDYYLNSQNNFRWNGLSKLNSFSSSNYSSADLTLFGNFGNNILDCFKGDNLYLHLAGIASTYIIVSQNIDYKVENYFNQHEEFGKWTHPIVFTGMYLPFVVGGSLYAYGKLEKNDEALGASFAVLQATLIEFLYNSTLKAITGRPHPDWRNDSDMESLSKTFRFGLMRGGIFWGWPSGHTSTTMAVVSALTNYYPNSTWLKIAGYSLVAYTILGVSSVNRGGMHWFSDAIAAAFMAYAVGSTVGKYYRRIYSASSSAAGNSSKTIMLPEANPIGINFSIQF